MDYFIMKEELIIKFINKHKKIFALKNINSNELISKLKEKMELKDAYKKEKLNKDNKTLSENSKDNKTKEDESFDIFGPVTDLDDFHKAKINENKDLNSKNADD